MDAETSQGTAPQELPRNLYFGAEDWIALQPRITAQDLAVVRNQRHALIGSITHKSERMLSSIRTLKDFDGTGHAGDALAHIEALRNDLFKLTTDLFLEVEDAEVRYETARASALDEASLSGPEKTDAEIHLRAAGITPADMAAAAKTVRALHLRNVQ